MNANHYASSQAYRKGGFPIEIETKISKLITYGLDTVVDRKDWTLHRAIEVKLPWLRAVPAGQEWILPLEKWAHFFLGPWLLVCQFIDISNQMETTGEVSKIEGIFFT